MRGGAVAEALIICGDPCRIRMDYVVCPSQDVDCDCWDRPAGESKMRCDVDDARELFFHARTVRPSRMWI